MQLRSLSIHQARRIKMGPGSSFYLFLDYFDIFNLNFTMSCSDLLETMKTENDNLHRQLAEYQSLMQTMEAKLSSLQLVKEQKQTSEKDSAVDDELSALKAENARLMSLTGYLENEVEHLKDTAHEQRIRALDLKHELREVSSYRIRNLYDFITVQKLNL
jgi:predicted  nucleic acid-binding Zn-ribbon protein